MIAPDAPIARLRRVRAALAAGRPVPPGDAEWLAAALATYETEAPAGVDLDRACGLVRRGGLAWWEAEEQDRRDDALRRLRREYLSDLDDAAAARAIAGLAKRVNRTPVDSAGARAALLLEAMAATRKFPAERQLRAILRKSEACSEYRDWNATDLPDDAAAPPGTPRWPSAPSPAPPSRSTTALPSRCRPAARS